MKRYTELPRFVTKPQGRGNKLHKLELDVRTTLRATGVDHDVRVDRRDSSTDAYPRVGH